MATLLPPLRAALLAATLAGQGCQTSAALAEGAAAAESSGPIEIPEQAVRIVGPDGEPVAAPGQTEVERYCTSIADQARDARYAAQSSELQAMEAQVAVRLDELEAKRAEYQTWLEDRRAFLDSADAILLDIYAQMKPSSAAAQMAGLDRSVSAAIIAKLKSRQASAILSEMKPDTAAEIAGIIATKTADPDAAGSAPAEAAGARPAGTGSAT